MKWITQKEASEAAEKGLIAAINHGILHWNQLANVTDEELMERVELDKRQRNRIISSCYCALCYYFESIVIGCCEKAALTCPIFETYTCGCCMAWKKASREYNYMFDGTSKNGIAFRQAAKAMLDKLIVAKNRIEK